ncbi:hypothetical protein OIU84_023927 [Salix udensis]|uniref:Uncharacterized protein n=1 Tax=Salix udensis TaxID=889485 RepID=A0AAD6J668_9ROSI|nr:hypothetical protein OIU84_023927 [Salix udensis]
MSSLSLFSLLHNNSGFNPIRDDKSFASKFNGMNSISMISNQINIMNNNIRTLKSIYRRELNSIT